MSDCNAGNAIITDETLQVFALSSTGSYSVIIDDSNCIDTSRCVSMLIDDSRDLTTYGKNVTVYPNPTHGSMTLGLPK